MLAWHQEHERSRTATLEMLNTLTKCCIALLSPGMYRSPLWKRVGDMHFYIQTIRLFIQRELWHVDNRYLTNTILLFYTDVIPHHKL